MTYQELKKRANEQRQQKKYNDAVETYRSLYHNHREDCDKWDIWGYAYCLRHLKEFTEAAKICREGLQQFSGFDNLKNLLAWCLFYCNNFASIGADEVMEVVDEIISLRTGDDRYSPTNKVIFKAVKYFKENNHKELIVPYLSLIDKNTLDQHPFQYTINNKNITLPSDIETYYSHLTEALFRSGDYQECLDVCCNALSEIENFHNGNDIWILRRKAMCNIHLNNCQEAVSILKSVCAKKKDWFVLKDLAEAYFSCDEVDEAFKYALKAVQSKGEFDMKVNLFELTGDIMQRKGMNDEARLHYQLALNIREANGWGIDHSLIDKAGSVSDSINRDKLLQQLNPIWKSLTAESEPTYRGTIINIMANNKAGFIKGDDGKSYYFSLITNNLNRGEVDYGKKVQYCLEDSFDKKKNVPTKEAVKIMML